MLELDIIEYPKGAGPNGTADTGETRARTRPFRRQMRPGKTWLRDNVRPDQPGSRHSRRMSLARSLDVKSSAVADRLREGNYGVGSVTAWAFVVGRATSGLSLWGIGDQSVAREPAGLSA